MHLSLQQRLIHAHAVLGIVVGGSTVYSCPVNDSTSRDWDGIIIVRTHLDMIQMIRDPQLLMEYLGVVQEEYTQHPVKDSLHHDFDAVRFSGLTPTLDKKSVKILTWEHFLQNVNEPHYITRVLSRKNTRIYHGLQYGYDAWNIAPAQTLDNNTYLLHDTDLRDAFDIRDATRRAVFGACADLIITDRWLHGYDTVGVHMITRFVRRLAALPCVVRPEEVQLIFARGVRFSREYRDTLLQKAWMKYLLDLPVEPHSPPSALYFWGVTSRCTSTAGGKHLLSQSSPTPLQIDPHDTKSTIDTPCDHINSAHTNPTMRSPFSSNSQSGQCWITVSAKEPSERKLIFWKTPQNLTREVAGAELVKPYLHVQPIVGFGRSSTRSLVCYPWFDGRSLAEIRLEHHRGSGDHRRFLLEMEMRRSEDILRVYLQSARLEHENSTIQQFYQQRLVHRTRLNSFYSSGICIGGTKYIMADLICLPIILNGTSLPPLGDLLELALEDLSYGPDGLVILGLGDGHGGNVMVSSAELTSNHLYVDYETVGWHSPWLDIAKPLYNDVFFELLYADVLGRDLAMEGAAHVDVQASSCIIMGYNSQRAISDVARGIWEIKQRMVMEPFMAHVATAQHLQTLEDPQMMLGSALLCCAILTRNFSTRGDVSFANLAAVLSLVQSHDWMKGPMQQQCLPF